MSRAFQNTIIKLYFIENFSSYDAWRLPSILILPTMFDRWLKPFECYLESCPG